MDSAIIWFDTGEQLSSSYLHFHLFNRNPHSTLLSQKQVPCQHGPAFCLVHARFMCVCGRVRVRACECV